MRVAIGNFPAELIHRDRLLDYPQQHIPCACGDLELVKALLESGIGFDSYTCTDDEDDCTPLGWLAQDEEMGLADKVSVAKVLLGKGADVDEGEAVEATEEVGDDDFAEFLRAAKGRSSQ